MKSATERNAEPPASTPPSANPSTKLSQSQLEMIEAADRFCQWFGVPRSYGQIYGLLCMSIRPLNLHDISHSLGIAASSASKGTRHLMSWRVIRQVWIDGDRRDHFEIDPDLSKIVRLAYGEFLKKQLPSSEERLERISTTLERDLARGALTRQEHDHCGERLRQFQRIQQKIQSCLPPVDQIV